MTTRTRPAALTGRWAGLLLAALVAVLTMLLGVGTASASGLPAAETRVGAISPTVTTVVGVAGHIAAGQHLGRAPSQLRLVSGHCVAANTGSKVVVAERVGGQALKPSEAVSRWDEFLGAGQTNVHPRTGLPDANRIVSADGSRSIRFGSHEMGSSPTKFHFHEETWNFHDATNTWFVDSLIVRVPFPKGSW